MNGLNLEFRRFAESLTRGSTPHGPGEAPLARDLLADYPEDPGFWLRFADTCRVRDDFPGAFAALECLENLLDQQRGTDSAAPAAVLDALGWWSKRCRTEMLKVMARGDPTRQPDLIRSLQELAALSYEGIGRELAEAWTRWAGPRDREQEPSGVWARQLERLATSHVPGHDHDLNVIHDLATAFMGAGRFGEAEQLFNEPPFTDFVARTADSRKKLQWMPLLIRWLRAFLENPLQVVAPFTSPGHRYVLAMVVWGDAFLDSLEQFTLPSLLAAGNLPYLREAGEAHLICFTTAAGAERLERMPVFRAVQSAIAVDIVVFPDGLTEFRDTYKLMSTMHLASMAVAKASRAHFFFLAPDIVVADNFLHVVDQRVKQGAEVVFAPGLMLQMETFGEEQAQRFPLRQLVLAIPPRQLLELGVRHVHPFVKKAYIHAAVKRRPSASVLLWPLAAGGYLAHCFHHTPYLVSATAMQRFEASLFFTIDGEFLLKFISTPEQLERCVLLADTRETNYFELSRGSRYDCTLEFDLARICRWGALQGCVAEWLFRQQVCYDPRETGSADSAHPASSQVVAEILDGMRQLDRETPGALSDVPIPFV